ncbi:MAG: phosphate acyltransferase PlsX [Pseudomonadota bacterium]|nr:phosphate acyltransferase PlsX [Pseudomonadota bacterium]
MSERSTISLDAMGGDFGPSVTVPAACNAMEHHPGLHLILVGDTGAIKAELSRLGVSESDRLRVRHASEIVEMDDPPAHALRGKKDSSMRVAINLVKEGESDAIVSAGNTGALMATARFVLKTLSGIDRPAIMTALPSVTGKTHMLDLGANVDCRAEHLFQFAAMGSVLANAVDGIERPRVGLLNVGQEAIKGNDQVKEANALLQDSSLNYIGYVEGDDIYCGGNVDVVVCDGFVGNVSLKSSEGVAKMITQIIKDGFGRNVLTKAAGLVAVPVLRRVFKQMDPRTYNGASLLGLKGIAVKSHGGADAFSFENAIRIAHIEATESVPVRMERQLQKMLNEHPDR